ncbi:hypothetical protein J1N35_034121 [Gossypium stocksii]|uniref:Uncharacterized protein n=1 Tax=Gossypium stocksii TaxID=47602 RepID=A0A9D3URD7_9ROSI|nr:hypothetical protein J1N35_034121 [Gossypium stocksii]
MEYKNINKAYKNIINPKDVHDRESDNDDDGGDGGGGGDGGESNNLSGFEIELTGDAISSSLMNSL